MMIHAIFNLLSSSTSPVFLAFLVLLSFGFPTLLTITDLLFTLPSSATLVFMIPFASFTMGIALLIKRMQSAKRTRRRPRWDPLHVYYNALGSIDQYNNGPYSLNQTSTDSLNTNPSVISIDKLDYTISSTDLTTPPEQPFVRLNTVLQYEQPIHSDPYRHEVTVANASPWLGGTGLPVTNVNPVVPRHSIYRYLSLPPSPSDAYRITHVGHHTAVRPIPSHERTTLGLGLMNMDPNMQVIELASNINTHQVDDDDDDDDYFPDPKDD